MEIGSNQGYDNSYQNDQSSKSDENEFVEVFKKNFENQSNLNNSDNSINSDIYMIHQEENSLPIIQENSPYNSYINPYPEEKIIVNHKDECPYPFTKGEGLETTLKKIGLKYIKSSNKVIVSEYDNMNIKFKTTKYIIDEKDNGKKKKEKKTRKNSADMIRKRIKNKIHKDLINITNSKLKIKK